MCKGSRMSLAFTIDTHSDHPAHPFPEAEVDGPGLRIRWPDGHDAWFHTRWLRENCPCTSCTHPDAWERTVDLLALPIDLRPERILGDEAGLHLEWPAHEAPCSGSHYSWDWLDRNRTERVARLERTPRPTRWRGGDLRSEDHHLDHASVMASDEGLLELLERVVDHGFAIVAEMPAAPLAVVALAEHIAFVEESHFDRNFEVRSKVNPENLAYTSGTLPPHNDLASRRHLPGVQFLHCIVNDAVGGESVLVDALTVAETLRDRHPDHFEILTQTPVRYTSVSDTWWIVNRGPVIEVDGDGEVIGTRIHPALLGPVDVEPEHIDAWYRAHDELVRLAVRPDMQFTFRLEAGQCQIFDNRRILHSRRHFDPSTGDRVLEGCYVTLDDFTSRMHTLRRQGADFRHR